MAEPAAAPAGQQSGETRETRIPMADGVHLAATLYLPGAPSGPQPCLLEALPYRKDDLTSSYRPDYMRLRDEFGYAVCRVDVRGTGSSGGLATDEYPEQEQTDLVEVVAWLARQPWCDGNIGMYGTSYSAFNSLQVACEQPPQLKAIVAIFGTDDRYTDDVHYRGGALKLLDQVDYCHYMTAINALPPVPAVWGEGWQEEWRRRVARHEPWLLRWLAEQNDGPYWRHGSVRPGYDRIRCPVMIVAGWADGYRNNSFRTVEALRAAGVPHRLLAGPWAHASTASSLPGPRIDLLPELAAWWDRWLRGRDDDVVSGHRDDGMAGDRPALHCFVRSSTKPAADLDVSEGRWFREAWPSPRVGTRTYALDPGPPYEVRADVGVDAWIDCAGHLPYGQSGDQRFDDAASLTWEWPAEEVTLLGQPAVTLRVSSSAPVAFCSVKLCDVFPDGTSALVSRGSLNLTHRDGHQRPAPLPVGTEVSVTVDLDACAYAFASGQRIRLSVAGADWPNTAAPPRPVTLTVHGGRLELPVLAQAPPFDPPELVEVAQAGEPAQGVTWRVERDVLARTTSCLVDHGSTYQAPYDGVVREHYHGQVSVDNRTFAQRAEADVTFAVSWPEGRCQASSTLDLRADAEAYDVRIDLQVRAGDDVVGERSWHERIPRRLQ